MAITHLTKSNIEHRTGAMTKTVDVGSWTIKFGKHKGKSFDYLLENQEKYVSWLLEKKIFNTDDEKYAEYNEKIISYLENNINE